MKILVACEFSGAVRDAFAARGHEAWSCDLLPSEKPGNHLQGDIRAGLLSERWDMVIAHPPCTYLCVSGARWWAKRREEQRAAIDFVKLIWDYPCEKMVIENPIGILSTVFQKPTQIIQPWQFGHGETKATCLWIRGVRRLVPTQIVDGREAKIHKMAPGPERWRERSRTYPGIAAAMAEQWG